MGAFAVYYDQPRTPTTCEQSLIAQFTHIASIAVERAQNDAALKRSEAFLAEAQYLSSIGSFSWRVATDEITWSEQAQQTAPSIGILGIEHIAPLHGFSSPRAKPLFAGKSASSKMTLLRNLMLTRDSRFVACPDANRIPLLRAARNAAS